MFLSPCCHGNLLYFYRLQILVLPRLTAPSLQLLISISQIISTRECLLSESKLTTIFTAILKASHKPFSTLYEFISLVEILKHIYVCIFNFSMETDNWGKTVDHGTAWQILLIYITNNMRIQIFHERQSNLGGLPAIVHVNWSRLGQRSSCSKLYFYRFNFHVTLLYEQLFPKVRDYSSSFYVICVLCI